MGQWCVRIACTHCSWFISPSFCVTFASSQALIPYSKRHRSWLRSLRSRQKKMMPLSQALDCGAFSFQRAWNSRRGRLRPESLPALPNCSVSSEEKQNREKTSMYPARETRNDKKQMILLWKTQEGVGLLTQKGGKWMTIELGGEFLVSVTPPFPSALLSVLLETHSRNKYIVFYKDTAESWAFDRGY